MPPQNVNLPERQASFVRKSVAGGRYTNASEVVRAALRLLEQQEAKEQARLKALRQITKESFAALDRGEYDTLTPRSLNDLLGRIDRRIHSGERAS